MNTQTKNCTKFLKIYTWNFPLTSLKKKKSQIRMFGDMLKTKRWITKVLNVKNDNCYKYCKFFGIKNQLDSIQVINSNNFLICLLILI